MTSRLEETRRRFEDHKLKFEKLRADVNIKLKFLEENKVLPSCSLPAQCIVCAYILLQKVCVCAFWMKHFFTKLEGIDKSGFFFTLR